MRRFVRVALVSSMWASNETGVIFPVEALVEEAKAVGAVFHTDAVQAAGRAPINLKRSAIDLLSLSAHKLHGSKGVGALYVRRGLKFAPMIYGGPRNARAGAAPRTSLGSSVSVRRRKSPPHACTATPPGCAHCVTGSRATSSGAFATSS